MTAATEREAGVVTAASEHSQRRYPERLTVRIAPEDHPLVDAVDSANQDFGVNNTAVILALLALLDRARTEDPALYREIGQQASEIVARNTQKARDGQRASLLATFAARSSSSAAAANARSKNGAAA